MGSIFTTLFRSFGKTAPEAGPPGRGGGLDERMARRRESVEQAVAEAMTGAGVLSSAYRREARAVDLRGHQFKVSIDLPRELASITTGNLAQIGVIIANKAKAKNAGEVIGVYWRVEHDAQAGDQAPLNLLASASTRNAPPVPVEPVVPAAPGASETPGQRVARLSAMMKDNAPFSRPHVEDEDEPDTGFANTVIGFDVDDKPAGKR